MKKIINLLLNPSLKILIFTFILTFIICGGAITIALIKTSNIFIEILSYLIYASAALSLTYSVYIIVVNYSFIKNKIITNIKKHKIAKKILEQYNFRTLVFATVSTILNISFVSFHIVLAFITDSVLWYISLASYYALLVILRGIIILYHRRENKKQLNIGDDINKYRFCGIVLTLIPFTLLIPILQIYYLDKAFIHGEIISIAVAAYTFYKITMAILNVIKSHKQSNFTIQAIRNIGLADALVSIFSLQTTLLHSFSEEGTNLNILNIFTGSIVCILSILIGVNMLIKIKKIKKGYQN